MNYFYNNNNNKNNSKPIIQNNEDINNFPEQTMQGVLQNSLGYFIRIEFLIGDSLLEVREGYLSDVGQNYLMIYNPEISGNILCDIYSVKFIYFSDYFAPQYIQSTSKQNLLYDNQSITTFNDNKGNKQNTNPQMANKFDRNVRATNSNINNLNNKMNKNNKNK